MYLDYTDVYFNDLWYHKMQRIAVKKFKMFHN